MTELIATKIVLTEDQERGMAELLAWWNLPPEHPDYFHCVLSAAAGCGKAQPLTEPVLTPTGFQPIDLITSGDYVISEQGKPVRVVDTFITENLNMYEVSFSDGSSTRCCEDHLWKVFPHSLRGRNGTKVLTLKQMLPLIQKDKTTKEAYAYKVQLTKPVEFPLNETLLHSYTFGYALGNGSSAPEGKSAALVLSIWQTDYENIISNIPSKHILSDTKEKQNTSVSLIALNAEFREFYNSFGLRGVKSVDKFIPGIFFTASKAQRISLVKGLCDSDGTCSNNKASFATSSGVLAKDFQNLIRSLGGTATISISRREDKSNIANTEFRVLFRTPFNPFALPRKAANYVVRDADLEGKKSIVSVVFIGTMVGKCLAVDSTEHLYLTKDYTVTHNTFLVKYFTKQLQKAYPLFTATTNEAARQLELTGLKDVRTTHSALGLIPYTGQEATKFIQGQLPECIASCNLLVIDEASMAGKAKDEEADDLIIDYVFRLGMRTLWLGDEYQLPPVESDNGISPIFEQGLLTVELHKVVRNKGAILEFCTLLRGVIDSPVKRLPRVPSEIRSISTPNFYRWMENPKFVEQVREGSLRIINWRNAVADSINSKIRQHLFGKSLAEAEAYLPTDQILFIKPLMVGIFPEDTTKLVGNKQIKQGASVNSKAEVLQVTKESLYKIPCYKCRVRIESGTEETAWIPTKEGQTLIAKLKTKLVKSLEGKSASTKRTTWESWHAFAGVFAQVKHSYAITTHRAQGATIPSVIVNVVDILSGANRSPLLAYKMLYTGCSRASESLTLIRG